MLIVAGFLLVYPKALFDLIGFGLVAAVVLLQVYFKPRAVS